MALKIMLSPHGVLSKCPLYNRKPVGEVDLSTAANGFPLLSLRFFIHPNILLST